MVLGVFATISNHQELNEGVSIIIKNTNFIKCSNIKGGGFFSACNVKHEISYCYFSNCEATDSSVGRGGGFLINNGTSNVKFCCAEDCVSQWGSDLMSWGASNPTITYLTSIRSWNKGHSLFISCLGKTNLDNINVTKSYCDTQTNYGNGINLYITDVPDKLLFFNLIENNGQVSVLEIEGAFSKEVTLSNVNIINNKNEKSYVCFYKGSDSLIHLFNSIFIGNEGNNILYQYNVENECKVYFERCSFDIEQPVNNDQQQFSDNCLFSQLSIPTISETLYCNFHFDYSCKQCMKDFQNINDITNILLVSCFIYHLK